MKRILVLYYSQGGHTAHITRAIKQAIDTEGHQCDMMHVHEALSAGVDFDQYDAVAVGSCVLYGSYHASLFELVERYQNELAKLPNSFYSVNVVARNPEKRNPDNNKYLQKFIELSPWKPQQVKVIAGKVNYPAWKWYDRLMIQMIMKMTDGPTDPTSVIDYTDYEDVAEYGRGLIKLAS
ncbi:menaquinone-dependent protoporphyrinogen IX dehydrogenase [Paraferrimonas sedimenticola]|uniref:Protoporphyrinogen IX dehydrogenase [quinone] n=1 Tax=Paraferrimonas sedimenticola TaxID=375674 RepID=A0AA37W2C3_9GAMM|nr:menaquinone-dependent protoporphyrinogen IX dehydrogenase [Paraferrimonas sedimenticola]GLP97692.1 protoporphyrinogen oxidase [Paraferrimonas sedimenticola]